MMWINMCVGLPLTILIIYCVCCVVRRSQVPIIYYTNLLISNKIQICIMIVWVMRVESSTCVIIHILCAMASLYFRVCIALERCFSITYPLLDCMTQTKSSVLVCVLVWAFCIVSVSLSILPFFVLSVSPFALNELARIFIYAALPGPLFIFCLARTFRALPAATSVPTEEKRRTLGALILLFFNYFLIIIPTISCNFFRGPYFSYFSYSIFLILFLLTPFVDLILFLFMRKGRIDRLLTCLCSAGAAADPQCG